MKAVTIEFDEPSSVSISACRAVLASANPNAIKDFNFYTQEKTNAEKLISERLLSLKAETFGSFLFWNIFLKCSFFLDFVLFNNKIAWNQEAIKAFRILKRFQNHLWTVSAAGINETKICQGTNIVQPCLYGVGNLSGKVIYRISNNLQHFWKNLCILILIVSKVLNSWKLFYALKKDMLSLLYNKDYMYIKIKCVYFSQPTKLEKSL